VRAIEEGFVYQGEPGVASGQPRGEPVTTEPASGFVFCTENHDQVGNRAFGERLNHLVSAGCYAAASALFLFTPETPLLFMGQEFAASTPFQYFTDHHEELGKLVVAGRREEFKRFSAFADPAQRERIPNPQAETTFQRSKLRPEERGEHRGIYRLYRDLLRLRREDPVLQVRSRDATRAVGIGIGDRALAVHRWHGAEHRWLIANFGPQPLPLTPAEVAELGLNAGTARLLLATSWRRYGGDGKGQPPGWQGRGRDKRYLIPAESAIVVAAQPGPGSDHRT
jgi:maltooligosyltrehalose trehalohydrolase